MAGRLARLFGPIRSRLRVSSALTLGFGCILIFTVLVGLALSTSLARRMEIEVAARNRLLALTLSNDMATFLNGYLLALQLFESEAFWTQEACEAVSRVYPAFRRVMLVNEEGRVDFASQNGRERLFDVSNRDFFLTTRGTDRPFLSPSFIAEGDYAPTAVLAVPGHKGLSVAYLNLETIGAYIHGLPVRGSAAIAIVDHHAYYIAHRDQRYVRERRSAALESWFRDYAGKVAGSERTRTNGNIEHLLSWAPVPGFSGWTVIVSEDAESVFAQAAQLRTAIVFVIIGVSFLAMTLIILVLTLFDRDIRTLRAHTTEVAGGNYDDSFWYEGFKDLAPLANDYRNAVIAVRDREFRIQENERRLNGLLDFMPIPVLILDEHETLFHINRAVTRIFGWTQADLPDLRTWWLRVYPDVEYRQLAQQHWAGQLAMLRAGVQPQEHFEGELVCKDGSKKEVVGDTAIFTDRIVVSFVDVSEAKAAESQMAASLREKEILLKEIHHRVKNNLQLIISLLNLKAQSSGLDAGAFAESIDRVRVMANIHEHLYKSSDLSHLDLREYITTIVDWIAASYRQGTITPKTSLDLASIDIDIDSAVPCGLIINELYTNALKYAFDPLMPNPAIRISSRVLPEGLIELGFADNGKGLPLDLQPGEVQSLGLKLIVALSSQLQGTWALSREGGTAWTIRFPWGKT